MLLASAPLPRSHHQFKGYLSFAASSTHPFMGYLSALNPASGLRRTASDAALTTVVQELPGLKRGLEELWSGWRRSSGAPKRLERSLQGPWRG